MTGAGLGEERLHERQQGLGVAAACLDLTPEAALDHLDEPPRAEFRGRVSDGRT